MGWVKGYGQWEGWVGRVGWVEGEGGWRGWWVARGGLNLPSGYRQQCCVFSKGQKWSQSTGQVEIVVDSSLAPVISLLMPFTSPTDPVLHHGDLTGLAISHQ